jgi:hypothetical protein
MSDPSQSGPPKIIVDSDWKSQAQAEKQRLEQAASAKAAAGKPAKAPGSTSAAQGEEGEEPRFEDLVGMLATQALSYMGFIADPATGRAVVSLEYAKFNIDMLGILEAKTRGNLSNEESEALAKTVSRLRGEFVNLSQHIARAIQEGKIKPMSAGGMGGGLAPGMDPTPAAVDLGSTLRNPQGR